MTDNTGVPYATISELKSRYKIDDSEDDVLLTRALKVATSHIEDNVCERQFNDTGSATARVFKPTTCVTVRLDDFSTSSGLIIKTDDNDDGVFETTWAAADYELRPVNNSRYGKSGWWPYDRIEAIKTKRFLPRLRRHSIEVTAQWGWATVPWEVKEATLILAEELWKLKDAPFGIAGSGEFGAVRVRENPKVAAMLKNFKRRGGVLVA